MLVCFALIVLEADREVDIGFAELSQWGQVYTRYAIVLEPDHRER